MELFKKQFLFLSLNKTTFIQIKLLTTFDLLIARAVLTKEPDNIRGNNTRM